MTDIAKDIINGYAITQKEALALYDKDLDTLMGDAERIRKARCGDAFDLCTIVNGKNGHCSENCAFCAQATSSRAAVEVHALLDQDTVLEHAKRAEKAGIYRYSVVAVGRRLSKDEVDQVASIFRALKKETRLHLCLSGGLLNKEDLSLLKEAGLERLHNNLETSRAYFPALCTTHSYDEKIRTIRAAQALDIEVCSGGIIGVGEGRRDRVDLALALRDLDVQSVPLNILHAIEKTPLAHTPPLAEEEILRTFAVFRHILPGAFIRLAGGRKNLTGDGERALYAGANAAITGDFLNTCGAEEASDRAMAHRLGFRIEPTALS
ncbi:MAG: biotin synthase BioB [Peptoniphilus sp.]|nr:biotin synthase BioB [Peptoniphilus sp.]MDD7362648.1 biotin synthase BioB [Bacillota bacterium]MDY6044953.1 biotin synthase BioB [Peptoniphilus sp.]